MDDSVINAAGVFVAVAAGTIVAGVAMGQLRTALVLAVFVGATFATATYLLLGLGE